MFFPHTTALQLVTFSKEALVLVVQFGTKVGKTKLLLLQNAKHQLSKVFSSMLAIHPNKPGK